MLINMLINNTNSYLYPNFLSEPEVRNFSDALAGAALRFHKTGL